MIAVISDVHANLEALVAVLEDIRRQGVGDIFCVGDVIGFGPNPCDCLDLVMESCKVIILGDHDEAAMIDPKGFNPVAMRAVQWTREQLERSWDGRQARWEFLCEIPRSYEEGDFLFVHGSPREPTHEYVFPEDVSTSERWIRFSTGRRSIASWGIRTCPASSRRTINSLLRRTAAIDIVLEARNP